MFSIPLKRMSSLASANSSASGPIANLITSKIKERFPDSTHFKLFNDSHKHAHHAGIAGSSNKTESHFRLELVSDEFKGMPLVKRHRLVYSLLDEIISNHGVHALQLTTRTTSEQSKKDSLP
ncbi:HDL189Cp [Eremothecium sinecaudum]|uniref:HDL189Cp n=1 Tax=Eremothecium sinecaudum TaxID=45286 RepID=A0A0X8HSD1_9SACH|nr:HDL189Cp [Eremothecium sinecaudum]AMD20555.1 HDL189Cp [Eremothecium sinecaudum]